MARLKSPILCSSCHTFYEIGDWPFCPHGPIHRHDAQYHSSQKTVYFEGPNGEIRIPGRADRPMHPKYVAEGYQTRTVDSNMAQFERKTGMIHEASHYDSGSGRAERDTGSI